MKLSKLLLAVVGATVLLGALVSTASAGRLRLTGQRLQARYSRLDFTGGFGTVECEVTLEGTLHSLTIRKINLSLIGLITAAAVRTPCRRGEATILRETLPWHVKYRSFSGTLPRITAILSDVVGASFRIREPTFGVQCLARTTTERPGIGTYVRNTATTELTQANVSGSGIPCGSFTGAFTGSSSRFDNGAGVKLSLTLI